LICSFTMVALEADYRLRQDDIPKLQMLLTCGRFPRTTLHSINIAIAPAKFPAKPCLIPVHRHCDDQL